MGLPRWQSWRRKIGGLTPHYRTIKELLQTRSFAIDDYQREYKWEASNIEELPRRLAGQVRDLLSRGRRPAGGNSYGDYFLGSIIVTRRKDKSYLVDGQQRVTSLTLLIIYLYREARGEGLTLLRPSSRLIFSDDYGERKFNLDIAERVPVIKALFNGEEYNRRRQGRVGPGDMPPDTEDIEERISGARSAMGWSPSSTGSSATSGSSRSRPRPIRRPI